MDSVIMERTTRGLKTTVKLSAGNTLEIQFDVSRAQKHHSFKFVNNKLLYIKLQRLNCGVILIKLDKYFTFVIPFNGIANQTIH